MKKLLKYGLPGLGILLVLVVGTIGYFMMTFNPNAYKPQIIQLVKDKIQRTLKLDGNIRLTIFPTLGVKIDNISLSEYKSSKEFAEIENVRISLALLPLLSRQVVVDELAFSGARANVLRYKDGTSNLDDLLGHQESKKTSQPATGNKLAPIKFDISSVLIVNTELDFIDEKSGAHYELKKINLKTGRIANGIPVKITLDAAIEASKPRMDLDAKMQTTLTFDLEKDFYKLVGMNMQMKGMLLDYSNLSLVASGDASANLSTLEYKAANLAVSASGIQGQDNFVVNANLPNLIFSSHKISVEKVTAKANLDGEVHKMVATLVLQDIEGTAHSFKSGGLKLDVGYKRPDQAFQLKVSTAINGSMDAKQYTLPNLAIALNASGSKLPNKSVSSEMKGKLKIDAVREILQLNLAGGLLQSKVKASMTLKNFSEPAIKFNVALDQLDADLYLPKKATTITGQNKSNQDQPFDLLALKKLNLDGSVRLGALKIYNVKSTKLRIRVKAKKGLVSISPLSADLYHGNIKGRLEINAAKAIPTFSVQQDLNGVLLGALIKDALDFDMLEGKAKVTVNIDAQGNTVGAIKKSLHGSAALNMNHGAIKGINLSKLVHGAQNLRQGSDTLKPVAGDKTEFSALKASFKLINGVAHNDDLLIKSQSLQISGNGDIDIGNSSVNYATKTTVADSMDAKNGSVTIPVAVQGPYTDLKFEVDYDAVVRNVVKQKINAKIEEKKNELRQNLQEKLKGGLQNLFK
jgi:AsmA protein